MTIQNEPKPAAMMDDDLTEALLPGARGVGYDYPHDNPGSVSPQELLPPGVAGTRFYAPEGKEPQQAERLAALRRARGRG